MEEYSFSRLSAFDQCKYGYWLQYINEETKHKGEDNAFAQYGSLVHSLMEKNAKGEYEVYELPQIYQDAYFDSVTYDFPPNKYVDLADEYYRDGLDFLYNYNGLDNYEVLGVEDEFLEEIDSENENFKIKGFIDLVYIDSDGRLIVHDWKSKSKFKSKAEQKEKARQLYMYALRIFRKYGKYPDILRFYLFRKQLAIDIPFKMDDYIETWDWVNRTVDNIRNCAEYPFNYDMFYCENLCDFRNICDYALEGID